MGRVFRLVFQDGFSARAIGLDRRGQRSPVSRDGFGDPGAVVPLPDVAAPIPHRELDRLLSYLERAVWSPPSVAASR